MDMIRPVSDLRNNFADISKTVHETSQPVFLTKNGYGDMVVMSMEAYEKLTYGLILSGLAMQMMGNSRPASGSEHHMSHFFEVTGIMNEEAYLMHGIDVVYSAIYTQKLREALLQISKPVPAVRLSGTQWEAKIREIYTEAADGVIALQRKLGWYERDLQPIYEDKWEEMIEDLKKNKLKKEYKCFQERAKFEKRSRSV